MSSFDMSSVDKKRLTQLLEQRALLDREIEIESQITTAIPCTSSIHHGQPFIQYPRRRDSHRRHHPRSGATMSRHTSNQSHHDPTEMSVSMSSHRSTSGGMARLASRRSNASNRSSMPILHSHKADPRLESMESYPDASVIESWTTRQDDPLSLYNLSHQAVPSVSQSQMGLDNIGEHPADYFSRMQTAPLPPQPTGSFNPGQFSHHTSPPRQHMEIPTTTPSTTLTTGTTLLSDMSRQSSFCNALEGLQMQQVNSNTSGLSEIRSSDDTIYNVSYPIFSSEKQFSSNEEQEQLLAYTGGASFEHLSPVFDPSNACSFTSSSMPSIESMKRSPSNESSSSTSSTQSRSKLQLQKQNQHAARKLAPKAGSESDLNLPNGSPSNMVRIESKDGQDDKYLTAITKNSGKSPYQRPKHEKLICGICNDDKNTFRGAHELERHNKRQHRSVVEKWVCLDPADVKDTQLQPVFPFSKCKKCTSKGKYNSNYNAAAHLRRIHFAPRTKNYRHDDRSEKRGGNGGGKWPSLGELKPWMKQVLEKANTLQPHENDDNEDENISAGCYNEDLSAMFNEPSMTGSEDFDMSDLHSEHAIFDMSGLLGNDTDISVPSGNFETPLLYPDTTMSDYYSRMSSNIPAKSMQFQSSLPSNMVDTNMQYMSSMPFNFPSQRRVDPSIPFDEAQSSFGSQSGLMNDSMPCINTTQFTAQNFEENSSGPESLNSFQFHASTF